MRWCPSACAEALADISRGYESTPFRVVHFFFDSTYSLVQVDGVLAGDNVGDGRALLLAGGLNVGHFFKSVSLALA